MADDPNDTIAEAAAADAAAGAAAGSAFSESPIDLSGPTTRQPDNNTATGTTIDKPNP